MKASSPRAKAGWAVIAVAIVGGFEGLRQNAYYDVSPARNLTICYGETAGVRPGDYRTKPECDAMLEGRLNEFYAAAVRCIPTLPEMPATRQAAVTSLSYNIGQGALCKSTVARKLNTGDISGACDAFMLWTKAGGVTFRGLVKRRETERDLCLA